MKKNGFVLLETIVVTAVLGMILVLMYPAFSNLISTMKRETSYDKVDYLYRTKAINEHISDSEVTLNSSGSIQVICEGDCGGNDFYGAIAMYLVNPTKINEIMGQNIYPTTKKYLKYVSENYSYSNTLLVVAYLNEEDADDQNYEYASVKYLTYEERAAIYGA